MVKFNYKIYYKKAFCYIVLPLSVIMSEKKPENDGNPDYQIGGFGEEISKDTSLGEDSEFIEIDYETAAVFKRLANDIYESTEAGIREPLQNSITAVKRAVGECGVKDDNGVIKIDAREGERVKLSLRDNGIGIKRSVLNQVLTVIGRSQNRDDGELSGKYGMGFLACYKLVGVRGGFLMHSNSRETEEEPIKGIWKPGGFEVDTGDELPSKMEDEYGTLFEFTLKQGVDVKQVREWVSKHSEWSTVPIIYTEYDEDGKEVFNEDYGNKSLTDHYSDSKSVVVDNEYFTAVSSPHSESRTLLINSPITRNGSTSVQYLGWEFDIRLKNENGVVVDGPNEGLQPADDKRYDEMGDERREKYVPKSDLTSEDVTLPEPTGTRDSLESDGDFWDYVSSALAEKYKSEIREIMDNLESKEDYLSLTSNEKLILDDTISRSSLIHKTNQKTKDAFQSNFSIDVEDELIKVLRASRKKVWFVEEGSDARKASRKQSSATTKCRALEVHHRVENDVYMAVSLNQNKMDAVWDDSSKNAVVRVNSSKDYPSLESLFGWNMLKDVKRMMDNLSLSDSIVDRLQSGSKGKSTSSTRERNSEKNIEDRHLTVHQKGFNRSGIEVGEIQDCYEGTDKHLILFPSNTDKNLSNHKELESAHVGIANCIVKVSDHLEDYDNVHDIDDWYSRIEDKKFKTNKGEMSVSEIKSQGDIIFHVLGDDVVDVFRDDTVIEEMETITRESASHNSSYGLSLSNFDDEDPIYVPVTPSELDQVRVLFSGCDVDSITLTGDMNTGSIGSSISPVESDIYWYSWALLPRWRDTREIETLSEEDWMLDPDWIWLINQVAESDYEIKSITGVDIEPPCEVLQFYTSEGNINLRSVIGEYQSVVLHILPLDTVDAFRTDGVDTDTLEYVVDNARQQDSFDSDNLTDKDYFNSEESIYIPVTESEAKDIGNVLDNPEGDQYTLRDSYESSCVVCVGGEKRVRGVGFKRFSIDSDTVAYAHSRLPESVSDATIPIDNHEVLPDLSDGGLEFIETMAGVEGS